jgi:DNA-nicking Smr family endonuclease
MTNPGSGRRADGARRLSPEEEALLDWAMRDVKPRRRRAKPPARPAPAAPVAKAAPAPPPSAPRPRALPPLDPEGPTAGLDKRTAERFARGAMRIDGRLDLHGLHQAEAHRELAGFIADSFAAGRRLVLVITGKGGGPAESRGVLRSAAPRWLNEAPLREKILAVREARPQHGGSGALYVLLKRRR